MKPVSELAKDLINELSQVDESKELRSQLQEFIDGMFIELPEQMYLHLVEFQRILVDHVPEDQEKHENWHKHVIEFWSRDVVGDANK